MRPVKKPAVPAGSGWLYELKLDGFRGVLSIENGRGSFTSKTRKPLRRFDDLAARLAAALPVKNAILDGEIVVMRDAGPDFYSLMFRRGQPVYAAFDLLWLNGRDLRGHALWRRKKTLKRLIADSPIGFVDHVESPALFTVVVQKDLEGIVAKRKSDPYAPDTLWVKVKHAGYSQNVGRWELFDRRR